MQDPRLEGCFHKSESSKYLALTVPYLVGNGVDIGSGGWPVVPWAIQIEQPSEQFKHYTNGRNVPADTEWLGDICNLPFKDGVLDWVYSSHLIEDFCKEDTDLYPINWYRLFREWKRCLKPGGVMVILVPDKELWQAYLDRGGIPNCSHFAPEPSVGDVSKVFKDCGIDIVEEKKTAIDWRDYSILCVGRRPL